MVLPVLMEMSRVLNTGLDAEALRLCVALLDQGVNPEALATVVRELRREAAVATLASVAATSSAPL